MATSSAAEGRARMWQSMRMLREFSIADLVATASVRKTAAYAYVEHLTREGYLGDAGGKRTSSVATKRVCRRTVWKLLRDTGPFAPFGAGKGDPNLDPELRETHIRIPKSEYERALKCVRACAGMADPEREVAALKEKCA